MSTAPAAGPAPSGGAAFESAASGGELSGSESSGSAAFRSVPSRSEPPGSEPPGSEPSGSEPPGSEPSGSEPSGSASSESKPSGSEPSRSAPRRALVVGATGYVGRALVAELRRRGVPTIAHVRFDSPRLETWRAQWAALGAECAATPWDRGAFAELVRERAVTHVFLCLGTTFRRGRGKSTSSVPDTYADVDVGLSALVVDACVQCGRPVRVVLLSAARARASSRNPYLAARGRIEDLLRASGLEFTIAQPSYITGPGRDEFRPLERAGAWFADMLLLWGAILGMQILRERYRSIGAPELAKALAAHAFDPAGAGKTYTGERLRDFP